MLADAKLTFPVYYPTLRTSGAAYAGTEPRVYTIRDEKRKKHEAYRIVVAKGPPASTTASRARTGRTRRSSTTRPRCASPAAASYQLYCDGSRLRLVAWKTRRAVYWVSNTLCAVAHQAPDARHRPVAHAPEAVAALDTLSDRS